MKIALCVGPGKNYGPGWVGFDIVDRGFRPLVLQDVRTIDGTRFRNAEMIFATPPCQDFSTARIAWKPWNPDLSIVMACLRIRDEAGVPFVMENVAGLQSLIGPSVAHRGPWHFWGDVGILPLGNFKKGWSSRTNGQYRPSRLRGDASVPRELIP